MKASRQDHTPIPTANTPSKTRRRLGAGFRRLHRTPTLDLTPPEDDAAAVSEDEPQALALGLTVVNGVRVGEVVCLCVCVVGGGGGDRQAGRQRQADKSRQYSDAA